MKPNYLATCSAWRLIWRGPVWRLSTRVNAGQLAVVQQIQRALRPLELERGGKKPAAARTSMAWPNRHGADFPELDGTNYFDVHHTDNDTMAQVDPLAIRQAVAAFARAPGWARNIPAAGNESSRPNRPGADA